MTDGRVVVWGYNLGEGYRHRWEGRPLHAPIWPPLHPPWVLRRPHWGSQLLRLSGK